ncbi:hypothetical protein PYCC9005_003712 [Savitreella phatthalungensis]
MFQPSTREYDASASSGQMSGVHPLVDSKSSQHSDHIPSSSGHLTSPAQDDEAEMLTVKQATKALAAEAWRLECANRTFYLPTGYSDNALLLQQLAGMAKFHMRAEIRHAASAPPSDDNGPDFTGIIALTLTDLRPQNIFIFGPPLIQLEVLRKDQSSKWVVDHTMLVETVPDYEVKFDQEGAIHESFSNLPLGHLQDRLEFASGGRDCFIPGASRGSSSILAMWVFEANRSSGKGRSPHKDDKLMFRFRLVFLRSKPETESVPGLPSPADHIAYCVGNGEIRALSRKQLGRLGTDKFDGPSFEIIQDFDSLYNLGCLMFGEFELDDKDRHIQGQRLCSTQHGVRQFGTPPEWIDNLEVMEGPIPRKTQGALKSDSDEEEQSSTEEALARVPPRSAGLSFVPMPRTPESRGQRSDHQSPWKVSNFSPKQAYRDVKRKVSQIFK